MNKEELLILLNKTKKVLNKEIIEYLNSVINLEFSVVKDGIIDLDTQKILSNLAIYRRSAKYNIYNRAIYLLKSKDKTVSESTLIFDNLRIMSSSHEPIFEFNYGCREDIGEIILHDTIFDETKYTKDLDEYMDRLYKLMTARDILLGKRIYDDKCRELGIRPSLGEDLSDVERNRELASISSMIACNEESFNIIDNFKLTDTQKKRIETANAFYEVIAEDYGIEKKNTSSGKSLVKTMPGLTIKHDVEAVKYF